MGKLKKILFLIYEYNISVCLRINQKYKTKVEKMLWYSIYFPYFLGRTLYCVICEKTVAGSKIKVEKNKMKEEQFPHTLAIVAIAKNEANNIREWIAYHLVVGVDIVYLYDNESDDSTKEQIQEFIDMGKVIYTYFPGKNQQLPAYDHAIANYKNECKYMAFIDCDEFLAVPYGKELVKVIDEIISNSPNAGGLGVNWALYGSSGYEKKQTGLLIETYLKRGNIDAWPNFHVKTIVNPRMVEKYISPHFPLYRLGAWSVDSTGKRQRLWFNHDVDFSVIRCNHYFCKSKEEFIAKRSRGMADRQAKYDMSKFNEYDLNDVDDNMMLPYVLATKKIMNM